MRRIVSAGCALALAGLAQASPAAADTPDQIAIAKTLTDGCITWIKGDAAHSVDLYLKSVLVFDVAPPRQKDHDMVVAFNKKLVDLGEGPRTCVYEQITPHVLTGSYAYSTAILHVAGKLKGAGAFDFRERSTDVWQKIHGTWRVLHEHNSVPVDVLTGKADLQSTP